MVHQVDQSLFGAAVTEAADPVVAGFHPAVAAWFARRFPGGPTDPQRRAWPAIASGDDVLVASPTGSGKTLTGFLVAIDAAYQAHARGSFEPGTARVLYLSPLRALAADVHENLLVPLEGIAACADELYLEAPALTVGMRTGDSTPGERAALVKHPPTLVVTTPESLYLLLTSPKGRQLLSTIETVIVDEIHTLARDKRGAHLTLSLERLDRLVAAQGRRLQRIGLSATQRPLELVGRLLSGVGPGRNQPQIIDCGHARDLDVAIELPTTDLEAVSSALQFTDVLDQIAEHVRAHRTTLIFVNTRKMAERVAHQLAERLDEDGGLDGDDAALKVASHHGSLSTARRKLVEQRLRAGDLRALVATASLELGIDVGPVELVCQIGSPRAIATFLQRIGRANHRVGGVPAGRLYPLNRDELVECTALLAAVRAGALDLLEAPAAPLDVLAQQLVAEIAAREEDDPDELFALVQRAAPYEGLPRATFDEVLDLISWGIMTGRGRRGALIHLDEVNRRVRPRKGARLTALLNGGAIPETGDYKVVLDPEGITVGSLHEDFAIEATIGDVFLLGTHSWRVKKVETGTVRVIDAGGAAPTVPFWLGEAPARTAELSSWVSRLRERCEVALRLGETTSLIDIIIEMSGVSRVAAEQVGAYLAASYEALGCLPKTNHLVIERFFDDAEGSQLVVHSPHGGRINRALGLALRKKFCVTFDFELQAAADDDTVVISLGPHHSFPLSRVPHMLRSSNAIDALTQAVLPHPMLQARWRWNLNRSLVVARASSSGRRPIHLQRMEAEDLLAATWPSLAACQENTPPGPIPVPDHVLVRQTVADTLSEVLDAAGLVHLLEGLESGDVTVSFVESQSPSPMSHGILTGRPYTYLDDAPLEERRTRAVPLERTVLGLADRGPVVPLDQMAPFDDEALGEVTAAIAPVIRTPDELHDLAVDLISMRAVPNYRALADELEAAGRLQYQGDVWIATERIRSAASLDDDDDLAADCLRGHLERCGPISLEALVADDPIVPHSLRGAPLTLARARTAMARLEGIGFAIELPDGSWCARHVLARLHRRSRSARRDRFDAVPISRYIDLLSSWQHVDHHDRLTGVHGVLEVIDQLQGLELAAGDWEREVFAARISNYDPAWLDALCLSGEVTWARLSPRVPGEGSARGSQSPSASTPLAIVVRAELPWLLDAVRLGEAPAPPQSGVAADLYEVLATHGAMFRQELATSSRRLPAEIDDGLWDLVARGLVTADSFGAVRSLLDARARLRSRERSTTGTRSAPIMRRKGRPRGSEGRWSLLGGTGETPSLARTELEDLAEQVAVQLLRRWGVVCFELWSRESFKLPWREVARALRRLEARGLVHGGRFVAGLSGEQFALREATEILGGRALPDRAPVVLSASDPLNLTGVIIPGARVPSVRNRRIILGGGTMADAQGAIA